MTSRPLAFRLPTCPHPMEEWRELSLDKSLKDRSTGAFVVVVGRCRACGPMLVRKVLNDAGERAAYVNEPAGGALGDDGHDGPPAESDIGPESMEAKS